MAITLNVDREQAQILLNVLEQRAADITKYVSSHEVSKHTQSLFTQRENIYGLLQQIDKSMTAGETPDKCCIEPETMTLTEFNKKNWPDGAVKLTGAHSVRVHTVDVEASTNYSGAGETPDA